MYWYEVEFYSGDPQEDAKGPHREHGIIAAEFYGSAMKEITMRYGEDDIVSVNLRCLTGEKVLVFTPEATYESFNVQLEDMF